METFALLVTAVLGVPPFVLALLELRDRARAHEKSLRWLWHPRLIGLAILLPSVYFAFQVILQVLNNPAQVIANSEGLLVTGSLCSLGILVGQEIIWPTNRYLG